ncbi:PDZ domain-containing protein [Motiliproteus coralliicola]|uniref:PDZ domain-containing protein n=1 Tax=Motiliproteus coralliicola TaxID=2283196 RepID=A0A369WPQ9_9GAMM|nr:M48 family metalloprotease [Motiliproteus coralliicola]RDE24078.1 PDZ domain-containing protein [Motiliproteus coralliicola]
MKLTAGGILLVMMATLSSGCATPTYQSPKPAPALTLSEAERQQGKALHYRLAQQQRLNRVSWPLLKASTDLCPDKIRPALGFQYANSHSFAPSDAQQTDTKQPASERDAAIREFKLGEVLQVMAVVPGSGADLAGIKTGDKLIKLGEQSLPTGRTALLEAPEILRQQLADLKPDQTIEVTLYRNGQTLTRPLKPQTLCDYPVKRLPSEQINAYADHYSVAITDGMLAFATNEDDLALVIAHELAHNLLDHIPATARNTLLGGALDLLLISQGILSPGAFSLGGSVHFSKAFESEADYLALYLLARAGYDLEGRAEFWRRLSNSRPSHILSETGSTHPGNAERYVRMQAAIAEIRLKQQRKEALVPNTIKP